MTPTTRSTAIPARPRLIDVITAERIKFFTLRSNPILVTVVGALIALAALPSAIALTVPSSNPGAAVNTVTSVDSLRFVDTVLWMQIVFAVIAVLYATSEYTSGQIKLSLTAVPSRIPVLASKAIVISVIGFLVGTIAALIAVCVPLLILPFGDIAYDFVLGDALLLAVASGFYLALTGVVALCIGMLIRNVVVAIIIPVALFSIVPPVLESIGNDTITTLTGYLPTVAGRVILTTFENPAGLTAWPGLAVLAGWALVLLALASWTLRARDA